MLWEFVDLLQIRSKSRERNLIYDNFMENFCSQQINATQFHQFCENYFGEYLKFSKTCLM